LENIGKNLNDHLRFPVAKIKFKNFNKFRNIFDKKRNSTSSSNLWPRYIVESDDLKSYGFFKGSYMSIKRILSCHPIKFLGGGEGFDPVNKDMKVKK